MALPVLPLALGAVALFFMAKSSSASSSSYSQAPADGSKPPKKEAAPPGKTWKEMPAALQEQVAAALGALDVSPATGELSGNPVTADAIKMASQTAALCESQGFYEVAKELKRLIAGAVVKVPTPPEAEAMKPSAPPGLTPAQVDALVRTLTLDRDPKNIEALIASLERMPASPQRDNYISMAKALLLQLAAAQSTTQTMQQIDEVIRSPGIAEVQAAVQPLPPVVIPVVTPAPKPVAAKPAPKTAAPKPAPVAVVPAPAPEALLPTYATLKPLTGTALLKKGSKGDAVRAWQAILRLDGYTSSVVVDGDYGDKTKASTVDWQKKRGLTGDGEVGPKTRAKIGTQPIAAPSSAPAPVLTPQPALPSAARLVFANVLDPTPAAKVLKQGSPTMTRAEVTSWQNILTALGYGAVLGPVDGGWGANTTAATKALQDYGRSHYKDAKPIVADGTVGPQTRRIVVARTAELRGVVIGSRRAA